MIKDPTFNFTPAIKNLSASGMVTSTEFENGPKINPIKIIKTYDDNEWEIFIDEWVHSLEDQYVDVVRLAGGNDKGIDVAGFTDSSKLAGVWDNYQCKHYSKPLSLSYVIIEIGKILWYSYNKVYKAPRSHLFIAPMGASTPLSLLLANAEQLKNEIINGWDERIANKITKIETVVLDGKFEEYVQEFNFKIFSAPQAKTIIKQHKQTVHYIGRFGGGLPQRPIVDAPPEEITGGEMMYTQKLFDAYSEHTGVVINSLSDLTKILKLKDHLGRSRESFYSAESFQAFVKEKAAPGTFENFQEEIYKGISDTYDGDHQDGYKRVVAVTNCAQSLALDSDPLNKSAFPTDRRGVCHQLANNGRLTWKK